MSMPIGNPFFLNFYLLNITKIKIIESKIIVCNACAFVSNLE